ncbi:hypothetical protein AMYX_33880 [Anaeromyxobacter diazotrophicus]|uniref:Lipoprotein n=1 Tax=Anaeromyxobacter diazotrophicus TaxID=2590199 RepID=A0A7I9VRU1_9BACT|nr:hypothetical protein AMYX_33880 [Anaeromyxobacter diazotrophicus]
MTRLWVLTAVLLALAIAACGADCDRARELRQGAPFGEAGPGPAAPGAAPAPGTTQG